MLRVLMAGLACIILFGETPAFAQRGQEISGTTCSQLSRSCFRVCALRKGEPAYANCEADCNNSHKACIETGTWKYKDMTVKVEGGASNISMLCKISPGGRGIVRGYVELTFSNLTNNPIPKGQTIFAQKGRKTVKFKAADTIAPGASATFRSSARAFLTAGECRAWY
jgi:hypothetical protein